MGLDGFHSLLSALSVKKDEEEKKDGAGGSIPPAAAAALNPKFAAAAPQPLPNNLPRKIEKGRRTESKSTSSHRCHTQR